MFIFSHANIDNSTIWNKIIGQFPCSSIVTSIYTLKCRRWSDKHMLKKRFLNTCTCMYRRVPSNCREKLQSVDCNNTWWHSNGSIIGVRKCQWRAIQLLRSFISCYRRKQNGTLFIKTTLNTRKEARTQQNKYRQL